MWRRGKFLPLALGVVAAALGLVVGLAVAGGGGVSQSDYDTVKEQVTALQQKSAEQQKVTTLVGAQPVPSPTPRPTPTPLPAGFTPAPAPPAPSPPSSFYEPFSLYVYADTVTSAAGETPFNVDATGPTKYPFCVLTSVFKRGMHAVWRFEVIDIGSGTRLTDKEIETAVLRLPSGEEIKGRFGRHGSTADSPWFWTAAWNIPLDYPLGLLDWQILVTTKDGKKGRVNALTVSIPERGVETRMQIAE